MRIALRAAGVLLIAALAGCGDDGTAPPASDFAGTWQALEITFEAVDHDEIVDVVDLGADVTLVLDADHSFSLTGTQPGEEPIDWSGDWSASSDVFTLDYGLGEWQFDYTLDANTLVLTGADGSYDFDDDGSVEDAVLSLRLTRAP